MLRGTNLGICHAEFKGIPSDSPNVTNLPARLCVKGRLIGNNNANFARLKLGHTVALFIKDRNNPGCTLKLIVASKFNGLANMNFLSQISAEAGGGPTPLALRFHRLIKPLLINLKTQFARNIRSKIDWKAVGVIQLKCRVSWQRIALQFAEFALE